jgi:DNA (cytosine-5)-methyltransferase 1
MTTKPLTTVELFAGIGGFRLAADSAGVKTIWANDVSQKACAVYSSRFGSAELVAGDLREVHEAIPSHDLLTAGFPCQPFSSAGKKQGTRDPRGTLFATIAEIVDRTRPRVFVLENVKRLLSMECGSHFATLLGTLTDLGYQVEWRLINAMSFGLPQNRQRTFVIGTCNGIGFRSPSVRAASIEELQQLTERQLEILSDSSDWTPISQHGTKFPRWGVASSNRFFGAELGELHGAAVNTPPVSSVLEEDVPLHFDFTRETLARIGESVFVGSYVQGVEILYNQKGGARMGYTVFGVNGVAPTLTSTASRHYERYRVGNRYRRLTNVEYARLQGFPDDHCSCVSDYDQYALYGNAVPPVMAEWALRRSLSEPVTRDSFPVPAQLKLAS